MDVLEREGQGNGEGEAEGGSDSDSDNRKVAVADALFANILAKEKKFYFQNPEGKNILIL